MSSALRDRAREVTNRADELWADAFEQPQFAALADARDVEADAWEEAGVKSNAEIARKQAELARVASVSTAPCDCGCAAVAHVDISFECRGCSCVRYQPWPAEPSSQRQETK